MKFLWGLIAGFATLALAGCSLSMTGMVDLDPVPYSFHPPKGLESKLSAEPMTGDWANEAFEAGIESAVFVTYTPDEGDPTTLMGAYFMPEAVFDEVANPNEPPIYGIEVARDDGYVLAVVGPQDSVYDSESPDGINFGLLYDALYNPESYMPK